MVRSRIALLIVFASSLRLPAVAAQAPAAAENPPARPAAVPAQTPVATTPIVVDLAETTTAHRIRVDAGTYRIVLMNAVVGRDYWLHVGPSLVMPITALQLEAPTAEARALERASCPAAKAAAGVAEAATETAVRSTTEALRKALAVHDGACSPTQVDAAREILAATRRQITETPVIMAADVVRELAISSRQGDHWSVMLNSTGRGVWQTTYGVALSPNRDDEYFTEKMSDSEFVIRQKPRDDDSLTVLPTVFFTWLSSGAAFRDIQHGPTLGLGVTTGSPSGRFSVLGGWSVRFNQNIGVVAGVGVYPHKRLDGSYRVDQVLKESLTSDQLNDDSIRFNSFVAFTLRLGSNPFKGSDK